MADQKKTSFSISPGVNQSEAKKKALEMLANVDDYMSKDNIHKANVELNRKIWKGVQRLTNDTRTPDDKAVSFRLLATEALIDLFDKYERGEGNNPFDIGVDGFKFDK